jgi:hypothetical protein
LDDLNIPDVDFIKIDTETWEHEILLGGTRTITHCRPTIQCEYDKLIRDKLRQLFKDNHYIRVWPTGNTYQTTETIGYLDDAVFIPKERLNDI